jgi:hypothetical protein
LQIGNYVPTFSAGPPAPTPAARIALLAAAGDFAWITLAANRHLLAANALLSELAA